MKRALLSILICLLFALPCRADVTAWLLGATDLDTAENQYSGRVGIEQDDVEFGLESVWQGHRGAGQAYGVYSVLMLPGDADSILGRQYIGYRAGIQTEDEDIGNYGPIAGILYQSVLIIEYQYRTFTDSTDQDAHKVLFGMRICF